MKGSIAHDFFATSPPNRRTNCRSNTRPTRRRRPKAQCSLSRLQPPRLEPGQQLHSAIHSKHPADGPSGVHYATTDFSFHVREKNRHHSIATFPPLADLLMKFLIFISVLATYAFPRESSGSNHRAIRAGFACGTRKQIERSNLSAWITRRIATTCVALPFYRLDHQATFSYYQRRSLRWVTGFYRSRRVRPSSTIFLRGCRWEDIA